MRYLTVLLLLCVIHASAQREAANWVFGGKGGLNFSCSQPQLNITPFDGLEGGSCISSSNGDLLFITDGDAVWSRDFKIMPNGREIGGRCVNFGNYSSSSQSSLFVPHPGNPNLYYLFTSDCAEDEFSAGLRYSIIDKTLNNGMGDVVSKNNLLVSPTAEKIAAVFSDNGKDVWVVTHGVKNKDFFAFLITSSGLNPTPVVSSTGQVHPGGRGYMKFSPDGKRLAVASFVFGLGDGIPTEIFSFDNSTGKVISEFTIPSAGSQYSVSFSPSGRFLYLSCSWTCQGTIMQYDLEAGSASDINASRFQVNNDPIAGALQLGIDGKMYVLTNDGFANYVGVIQFPDKSREQCAYNMKLIELPCTMMPSWGLTNFIESYFLTPTPLPGPCAPVNTDLLQDIGFEAGGDCNSLEVTFKNTTHFVPMEVMFPLAPVVCHWQFGDGFEAIVNDFSDQQHTYQTAGTYTVKLTVGYWYCMAAMVIEKEIVVPAVSSFFRYTSDCNSLAVAFESDHTITTDLIFEWDFGDGAGSNSPQPNHTYTQPGEYNVRLKINSSCGESVTERKINVYDVLQLSLGDDKSICFNESVRIGSPQLPEVTYDWNIGSTQAEIYASAPGTYQLKLKRGACEAEDEIKVAYKPCEECNKTAVNLGADVTLCNGDTVILGIDPAINGTLLWNNFTSLPTLAATTTGKYWLSLTQGLCVTSDTVTVTTEDCETCDALVTNIITRLDDDKNDEFVFQAECEFSSYRMDLYNRWGKFILSTDDPTWDGKHDNQTTPAGVYYYIIHYTFQASQKRLITNSRKGWLHIVD